MGESVMFEELNPFKVERLLIGAAGEPLRKRNPLY